MSTAITRRARLYARATLDGCRAPEPLLEALPTLVALFEEQPLAARVLQAPRTTTEERRRLGAALARLVGAPPLAGRLVAALADRRSLALLSQIAGACRELDCTRRGVKVARVTSARPLADEDRRRLLDALGCQPPCQLEIDVRVDPTLIAGAVVRIGDTRIDGTVRARLRRMRARLAVRH